MRTNFGIWGGHIKLFDMYEAWRDERQALIEAGINPRTGDQFDERLLEAVASGRPLPLDLQESAPDTKADFSTFLWEPVSANFYQGYDYVESVWDQFVGVEAVDSFDEVRIKGINGLTGVGYVGELGDYPSLRRTFRPEAAVVVDTYGGDYGMTRKLLRSNGVQKLVETIPEEMGQAHADFVTRLIIALIIANPNAPDGAPMYSTGRGNQAAVPVSEDSVIDAAVWLRTRRDPDNRPIRTQIKAAVTQNDRQSLRLRQIAISQTLQIQTGGTVEAQDRFGRGTANPIAQSDILPLDGILVDPWLPDANDTYFFSDPKKRAAFIAAFLDGQRKPMLGMSDATVMHLAQSAGNGHDPYTFHGDKIEYKGRQDVGATAVEPLSTYRLNPA